MNIPVNHSWGAGPTTKQALRQANRHRAWRQSRWPTVLIGGAWLAFAAIAVGVMR